MKLGKSAKEMEERQSVLKQVSVDQSEKKIMKIEDEAGN